MKSTMTSSRVTYGTLRRFISDRNSETYICPTYLSIADVVPGVPTTLFGSMPLLRIAAVSISSDTNWLYLPSNVSVVVVVVLVVAAVAVVVALADRGDALVLPRNVPGVDASKNESSSPELAKSQ